jgi:hypothetical protein
MHEHLVQQYEARFERQHAMYEALAADASA